MYLYRTNSRAIASGTVATREPSLKKSRPSGRVSTIADLRAGEICASGVRSLTCDEGENDEYRQLDGYGQQQLENLDEHFDRRRQRSLKRPRRFKQGSGAAGNPKPHTEVARSGPRQSTVANEAAPSPPIIAGPSENFIGLTRNIELAQTPPARFEPTTKGPHDVVI